MARAGAGSNRGPTDTQIMAAIRSTHAKMGNVHCIRYRVRTDFADPQAAESLASEITNRELERFASQPDTLMDDHQVDIATHRVLAEMSRCANWVESRQTVGCVFHRYWSGLDLTVGQHGTWTLPGDDFQEDLEYEYQIKPLARIRGVRLGSVWGLDGKPGSTLAREDSATRAVIRILLTRAGTGLPMLGSSIPMLEVRSIKVGELDKEPVYGFTVLGASGSLLMRLNAAAAELKASDMELVTTDDYRERLVCLKLAGNQQQDSQEAATSGRKYMIWSIPRSLVNTDLEAVAQTYFEGIFVESQVTVSAQCHPYAWFILSSATADSQQKAADFEAVLQARWGLEISLALSKTRQQRIRMNAANRDRIDQRESLNRPEGVLKEIMIPAKVIQDALMESAFLELFVDQFYSIIGPKIVLDIVAAIEERVEKLVAERVEAALDIKMEAFSANVLAKVFNTIDSAVDVSISRALESRTMGGDSEGDDLSSL